MYNGRHVNLDVWITVPAKTEMRVEVDIDHAAIVIDSAPTQVRLCIDLEGIQALSAMLDKASAQLSGRTEQELKEK
ncbi:hypothetical protein JOD54_001078 [Actinokineospora baliensis]|uniref:hypothetical protein n=1 Tax=Actinokineospora baliensis TaxID=547056 RepID=UPI0019588E2A|nr:hypothetical protein [Actinokineospora baliensis]MBM7770874.1 hypothetical protein [Actinokineospora baliensis]